MKFEVTNPKAWKAVNEKNMPMAHKIKVYEKLGGAYRLGNDGGEQVFNKMTELLKHKIQEDDDNSSPEETLAGLKDMAMGNLERIADYANMIETRMKDGQELDSWMYSQLTVALENLNSVHDAMDGDDGEREPVKEGDGLWANIRAKQARGEKPAAKNSQAYKDAVKAGNKINKKENILNEDLDALGLLIPALGALIGGGLAQLYPYFTGRPNIYSNIKDWWNSKKDNSEMNKIANRIKNDPDVQEFLKKKNKSGWKEMLKKKLTGSELNYLNKIYRSRFNNESVNEAPNTGEKIQNLNNRIKVLRDKISATKSPEQKKLHSDRLKNALQSLSNIRRNH